MQRFTKRITDPTISEGSIVITEPGGFARTVSSVDGGQVFLEPNDLFRSQVIEKTDIHQIVDLMTSEPGGTIYRVEWS